VCGFGVCELLVNWNQLGHINKYYILGLFSRQKPRSTGAKNPGKTHLFEGTGEKNGHAKCKPKNI